MKKKVTKITQSGNFESQYGHFYKWLLEFEDGFKGEYLSKTESQNKFIEGQEVEIEVTTREYNGTTINKIKPASTFQGGSKSFTSAPKDNKTQEYIVKQNALTNACNIVGEADVAKILEIADSFKEWVLNDVKPKNDSHASDLPF
jgi:hypothetical protein|tara:strand:+ start:100 stop:534 length:435 start_codon:yes stop_codon:yes gene_type:complete